MSGVETRPTNPSLPGLIEKSRFSFVQRRHDVSETCTHKNRDAKESTNLQIESVQPETVGVADCCGVPFGSAGNLRQNDAVGVVEQAFQVSRNARFPCMAVPSENDDGSIRVALEILDGMPCHGRIPEELRLAEIVEVHGGVTVKIQGTLDEFPVIFINGACHRWEFFSLVVT